MRDISGWANGLILLFLVLMLDFPAPSRAVSGKEFQNEAAMPVNGGAKLAPVQRPDINSPGYRKPQPTQGVLEKEQQKGQVKAEQGQGQEKKRWNNNNFRESRPQLGPSKPPPPTSQFLERLCRRNFVFIIASGRSGSTSLLNMVNELPGYSISGEHAGQFWSWHELYHRFLHTQGREPYFDHQTGEPRFMVMTRQSWEHQAVHDVEFFEMMQDWYYKHTGMRNATGYYNGKASGWVGAGIQRVKGCKEIRYNDPHILDFISHVFPCAKFIFNSRRALFGEQMKSAFYKKKNSTEDQVRMQAKFLMEYHESDWMKGRSMIMHMEDFQNLTIWNQMADFLERPYCRFNDVYHDNADSGYSHESKSGPVIHCTKPKG